MNALSKIEAIPLPDLSKAKTLSLPAWGERSRAALGTNLQIVHGTFREVKTLPKALLPTAEQRKAIEDHMESLSYCLLETAERREDWALRAAKAATGLVLALAGGDKRSELASEAKGEAYVAALEDVPCWAVEAAARRWYRGDCGKDQEGREYDYKWAPEPALLRKIAMQQVWLVRAEINDLQALLDARAYVDCSKDLEDGKLAFGGLNVALASGDIDGLTFARAIELGRDAKQAPAPMRSMSEEGKHAASA